MQIQVVRIGLQGHGELQHLAKLTAVRPLQGVAERHTAFHNVRAIGRGAGIVEDAPQGAALAQGHGFGKLGSVARFIVGQSLENAVARGLSHGFSHLAIEPFGVLLKA